MTILVTGATGNVGSQVIKFLNGGGADACALTRSPEKARLPEGVSAVAGDLTDIDSIRAAMEGVSTLFLVVANSTDELGKAMGTLNAARDAKIKGVVYLSVFKSKTLTKGTTGSGGDATRVRHGLSGIWRESSGRGPQCRKVPQQVEDPCRHGGGQ
jgi:uncharacterized protein YbjT (DUF2867 family)